MKKLWFLAAVAASTAALPAIAEAAPAFSTGNVNMRSGPSTRYPAVIVIPVGSQVDIRGCLSSANWCDVAYAGYRGWVSGTYLQASYSQRRVYVDPQYYRPLGIPTVTFSIGRYWDDHYRNRPFYRDRDRWRDNDRGRDDDRDRDRRTDNRGHRDAPVNDGRRLDDRRGDNNAQIDNSPRKNDGDRRAAQRERPNDARKLPNSKQEQQRKVRERCDPSKQRCEMPPQRP